MGGPGHDGGQFGLDVAGLHFSVAESCAQTAWRLARRGRCRGRRALFRARSFGARRRRVFGGSGTGRTFESHSHILPSSVDLCTHDAYVNTGTVERVQNVLSQLNQRIFQKFAQSESSALIPPQLCPTNVLKQSTIGRHSTARV